MAPWLRRPWRPSSRGDWLGRPPAAVLGAPSLMDTVMRVSARWRREDLPFVLPCNQKASA